MLKSSLYVTDRVNIKTTAYAVATKDLKNACSLHVQNKGRYDILFEFENKLYLIEKRKIKIFYFKTKKIVDEKQVKINVYLEENGCWKQEVSGLISVIK